MAYPDDTDPFFFQPTLLDLAVTAPPPLSDPSSDGDGCFGVPQPGPKRPNLLEMIMAGDCGSRPASGPQPSEGTDLPELPKLPGQADSGDPFPGHTISPEGAQAHQTWADNLPNDSDPSQTAGFLNNVIGWNGDQGRGDVADLLGRFQKIDPEKASTLQDELHRQSGERIPFRIAPLGEGLQDPAEADPALTLPDAPFGSGDGANPWAAGNMADVLLGKGDYADAVTHYRGQSKADPDGTRRRLRQDGGSRPDLGSEVCLADESGRAGRRYLGDRR